MRWLLQKDLRILSRSPLLVAMLIVYPIVIAALVGFAVTSGPSKPRVAVLNQVPKSATQVQLGGESVNVAEEAKPLFDAIDPIYVQSRQEAIDKVKSGDVLGALILPPDITRKLEAATTGNGSSARTTSEIACAAPRALRSPSGCTLSCKKLRCTASASPRTISIALRTSSSDSGAASSCCKSCGAPMLAMTNAEGACSRTTS